MTLKSINGVGWLETAIRRVVVVIHGPSGRDRWSHAQGRLTWVGPCPSVAMLPRAYRSYLSIMVMTMFDMTRGSNCVRRNEPAAVREIPETDFDLVIYEGRDRKTGRPYYHFKLVRTDGEKWFATCRPYHLFHLVKAIQFAAIGFSRVEAVGDVLVREQLAALALQLQSVSLPGDDNEEQKVNGLAGAFTRAD